MDDPTPTAPEALEDPCPHCGQPVGDAWLVCAWCGTQIAAPAELEVGTTLADGRYQVLGIIGRGGFGITYEVGDTRLKRRVAVKELFPESAVRHGSMVLTPPHARASFRSSRERFLREARVLARFTHPGIVRVYEVFEEHGTAYLVMELLSGRTLVDIMRARDRPFTEPEVLDVAGRVAAALRPVHAAGVLHRDINPSNVMLTEHGRIVVIDFGLARDFDQDQTMGMTRMVTPGYAPLEQYRGEGRFGPTTDVYGLAATCYRLATGRVPVAAVERDGGAELPPPRRLNEAITKPVSDAILDGLELEPAHRPQDLDAFLARMHIRWLPDTPRSILLGTEGAMTTDLAGAPRDLQPTFGLADPGPAVSVGPTAVAPLAAIASLDEVDHVEPFRPSEPPDLDGSEGHEHEDEGSAEDEDEDEYVEAATAERSAEARAVLATELVAGPGPVTVTTHWAPAVDGDLTSPLGAGAAPPAVDDRTWVPQGSAPGRDDRTQADEHTRGAPLDPRLDEEPPAPYAPGHPELVPTRGKVTVPLAIVAIAVASAAPVIGLGAVVLLVLPALATLGDAVARRLRADHGVAGRWGERHLPAVLWLPLRFVRNVVASVLRTSPIIGVTAVLLAGWYALDATSLSVTVTNVLLRIIGGGAVAVSLLTAREGSSRFRTGMGIDELAARSAPEGRTTERLIVAWLVMAIIVVAALWLDPDTFPLP
ncbi:protein kinase domain-containing protein [Aquihabitans sp. McL0605]|uniref:protein kinase domain-containing protein n=1 Tax=Aquihabitans sp. McL0605 TaxID=3415671 RepID=UPI003CE6938C